jgi:hypothetical protein
VASECGFRVLSYRAAPAEARLSFTALTDLLAPIGPSAFRGLPDPRRRALDAALLRDVSPDRGPDPRAMTINELRICAVEHWSNSLRQRNPPDAGVQNAIVFEFPESREDRLRERPPKYAPGV